MLYLRETSKLPNKCQNFIAFILIFSERFIYWLSCSQLCINWKTLLIFKMEIDLELIWSTFIIQSCTYMCCVLCQLNAHDKSPEHVSQLWYFALKSENFFYDSMKKDLSWKNLEILMDNEGIFGKVEMHCMDCENFVKNLLLNSENLFKKFDIKINNHKKNWRSFKKCPKFP